jgi:hypothetical protein
MIVKPWSLVVFLIKYPDSIFKMLLDMVQASHKIVPFYSPKYPGVLLQAARLLLCKGFDPQEALQLGLLELDFPKTELCKFASKREMMKIQKSLNPEAWLPFTEDKSIFYMYCNALGLPVPKLYAIFLRGTAGYSTNGSILRTEDDWEKFINNVLPSEFIVKPANGAFGVGVMCFLRTRDKEFINVATGKPNTAKDIYDTMLLYSADNAFVIQERLINHPELIRLSGTEYLQTLRVLTFVDRNGQCRILRAILRTIVGHNIIDNHDHGRTGNLLAEVSLDRGTLKPAVKMTFNVSGIKTVFSHPKTGVSFEEFHVPLWDDVCMLVKEASLKFLPLRTIGWDIAVTPQGPYIVEGNAFPDPLSFNKKMDVILSALCAG